MIVKEKLIELENVNKAIEFYEPLGVSKRKIQNEFVENHTLKVGSLTFNASLLKNINGEVAQRKALETILKNSNIPKIAIENIFYAFSDWKRKNNFPIEKPIKNVDVEA